VHRKTPARVFLAVTAVCLALLTSTLPTGCCCWTAPGGSSSGRKTGKAKPATVKVRKGAKPKAGSAKSLMLSVNAYAQAKALTAQALKADPGKLSKAQWEAVYSRALTAWYYAYRKAEGFRTLLAAAPAGIDPSLLAAREAGPASARLAMHPGPAPVSALGGAPWEASPAYAQGLGSFDKEDTTEVQLDLSRGEKTVLVADTAPPGRQLETVAKYLKTDAREAYDILSAERSKISSYYTTRAKFFGAAENTARVVETASDVALFVGGLATGGEAFVLSKEAIKAATKKQLFSKSLKYVSTGVSGADLVLGVGETGVAIGIGDEKTGAAISQAREALSPFGTLITIQGIYESATDVGNWKTYYNWGSALLANPDANKVTVESGSGSVLVSGSYDPGYGGPTAFSSGDLPPRTIATMRAATERTVRRFEATPAERQMAPPSSTSTWDKPPGKKSCPYLYAWDGRRFVRVNDVISVSRDPARQYDDWMLFESRPRADGASEVRLEEMRDEESFIDEMAFFSVDAPPGARVAVTPSGEVLAVGGLVTSDRRGVRMFDGTTVIETFDVDGEPTGSHPPITAAIAEPVLLLTLDGFERAQGASAAANGKRPGVDVEVLADGSWRRAATVYPRDLPCTTAVRLPGAIARGRVTVRLTAASCDSVTYQVLDRLELSTAPAERVTVRPATVRSMRLGGRDVHGPADASDSEVVHTVPGDRIDIVLSGAPGPLLLAKTRGWYRPLR
jgi:hypothetical protein